MAKTKYYLLAGGMMDGKEAEGIGLVSKCLPRAEALPAAMKLGRRLPL